MREWVLTLNGVNDCTAEIFHQRDINGPSLLILESKHLEEMGVTFGQAILIIHARDELKKLMKEEPESSANKPGELCNPYPFGRYHDTYRYMEGSRLNITESGELDLIEPCHEYKAFSNTTAGTQMDKFTKEVIRFAAACMNCRTNGTIHFGIIDKPHGEVLGVVVEDKQAFAKELKKAIDHNFEFKHRKAAQTCIKPPRFVGILNKNWTSSNKYVIEVDIIPDSSICQENVYHTLHGGKKFHIRDGESSRNLFLSTNTSAKNMRAFNQFVGNIAQLSERRKKAEEKHLSGIKSTTQGSRLSQMVTGGSFSLDKSHFERYVIVTNKSDVTQFDSLEFLVELNPTAVLDFDPESAKDGLQHHFDQLSPVTVHLPKHFKITEEVEDIANKLKLTRSTSWVFCNGGIENEAPSDRDQWLVDKGASVRDMISFLCRKVVLPNKRFLVIFLLLSRVSQGLDPLVETFSTFWQELKGEDQILSICDSENTFRSWCDLISVRCGIDISARCIHELSFAEVNGTLLSLMSKNRRSSRFLPSGGKSKTLLEKKFERNLSTLEILCVNQGEGGNEDKSAIEENFYKGGKVSWWNFFFSEQPGSTPFIKRDKIDFIIDTVLPELLSLPKACVLLNLMHVPGCGGTTSAMHTLWVVREKFRCAVLRDSKADFTEVAEQVVKLLTYGHEESSPRIPVLLMIDDFDDKEKVFDLQLCIEKECVKKDIQSKSPQVILLNCMVSESLKPNETEDTVFIGNDLSEKEKALFEEKLREIEKKYKNAEETFYGFMFMKKNFSSDYAQSVARKTLRSFDISQQNSQLFAILALLQVYCKGASLSVSLSEEFLDLQPKPFCGMKQIEDGFGNFSALITTCSVESKVVFQAVKIIHSSIAKHCLMELEETHKVSKADILDRLLTTSKLYESTQGKEKLLKDVHYILVKRNHSAEEQSQFSPLIQDIAKDTPGIEEMVLINASKRYEKDAVVCQLLARYYYLKKKDFLQASLWAKNAKDLSKDNSYIADTSAQVIKHELKKTFASYKEVHIDPGTMKQLLKMAKAAIEAFRETQNLAKKESIQRFQTRTDYSPFNTAGYLGEIQVGLLITDILLKTPVFSPQPVRRDIMSEFLSRQVKLEDVERADPSKSKHRSYYMTLREFQDLLQDLKYKMKVNFEFLENFFVNLGSRFGMKDKREEVNQKEFYRCFKIYAEVFCKFDSSMHSKNKHTEAMLNLPEMRQYLERNNADTSTGILSLLSNGTTPAVMEKITRLYNNICHSDRNNTLKDSINFIYANVVLSHIKLGSQQSLLYEDLVKFLCYVLSRTISLSDNLPLHFIAVVLLWPEQYHFRQQSLYLGCYISQLRTSYDIVMKEVCNGKRPVVHFFLGKKPGYGKLVHIGEIQRCIEADEESFSSMQESGRIWKDQKVVALLHRVTGEVYNKLIQAETHIPGVRFEVTPVFRNQLTGRANGSKVSFLLGFTMKGPVALDIN